MFGPYTDDLASARRAAGVGAQLLLQGWRSHAIEISHKGKIDLLTQYDPMSEEAIVDLLQKEHPGDAILAEEGGSRGESERVWCIDPLDGTTNFSHGLPLFATSVALMVQKEAVVGVVNNPALGYEFYGVKGHGAFLNGEPLPLLGADKALGESLVLFGAGYDRTEHPERYLPMIEHLMVRSQGLRRSGAASLDCCFVARGWADAYLEVHLHPWDLAAGALIASEAGAHTTDVDGSPFSPFSGRVMVARPGVHAEVLNLIQVQGLFKGEFDGTYEQGSPL